VTLDRLTVARMIDHTLLAPEATAAQVRTLCEEAVELDVAAVCVSPSMLPLDRALLTSGAHPVKVCTVVGFPSGAHTSHTKAAEAAESVRHGAEEVDVVIDLGLAIAGRWDDIAAQVSAVRAEVPAPLVLKVIVESAALSIEQVVAACHAVDAGGADFVKTSTGFHPSGGATLTAVQAMHETVGGRLGVKASGGIRDADRALAMIQAGATRIGTSSTRTILSGL
jgi:deoxyribose-phosphate aldolase